MILRRLGILLSGRGSNFEAIANNIQAGALDADIAIVISNKATAKGLETAQSRGLKALHIPYKDIDREAYDRLLAAELRANNVELVCLAGYMRLLSPWFTKEFEGRIINIHPSLLPAFPGLDAQHQAMNYGVRVAGCTVHFVDENLDSGPIIEQATVPVLPEDTEDTLSARILEQEHRIYTEAIRTVLSGRYRVEGRRVIRLGAD
jgi:phosphoribosylglycinamide formyltransferase-1